MECRYNLTDISPYIIFNIIWQCLQKVSAWWIQMFPFHYQTMCGLLYLDSKNQQYGIIFELKLLKEHVEHLLWRLLHYDDVSSFPSDRWKNCGLKIPSTSTATVQVGKYSAYIHIISFLNVAKLSPSFNSNSSWGLG